MPTEVLKVRRHRWIGVVGFCLVLLFSIATAADTLTGKVVKITDGDTLYVLDANYEQHKIRLAGIDAPERRVAKPTGQGFPGFRLVRLGLVAVNYIADRAECCP